MPFPCFVVYQRYNFVNVLCTLHMSCMCHVQFLCSCSVQFLCSCYVQLLCSCYTYCAYHVGASCLYVHKEKGGYLIIFLECFIFNVHQCAVVYLWFIWHEVFASQWYVCCLVLLLFRRWCGIFARRNREVVSVIFFIRIVEIGCLNLHTDSLKSIQQVFHLCHALWECFQELSYSSVVQKKKKNCVWHFFCEPWCGQFAAKQWCFSCLFSKEDENP